MFEKTKLGGKSISEQIKQYRMNLAQHLRGIIETGEFSKNDTLESVINKLASDGATDSAARDSVRGGNL